MSHAFDELSKTFATGVSRRNVMRLIAAGFVGALLPSARPNVASAGGCEDACKSNCGADKACLEECKARCACEGNCIKFCKKRCKDTSSPALCEAECLQECVCLFCGVRDGSDDAVICEPV